MSQQYLTILPDFIGCCLIRTKDISIQMQLQSCFGSFFIYSLFFAGESPSLVKNVEAEFEIKSRHPISRENMSVDQSFLVHCSRRSSYFSNSWCAQSMLISKGIVNSAMITFFWINWPNDEIWTLYINRCDSVHIFPLARPFLMSAADKRG